MIKSRVALLAKQEVTYGTDSVPTNVANAVMCSVPEFSVVGRRIDRANALSFMGKGSPLNVGEACKIKFDVELKGKGGLADVPPEFSALLQACNMTEAITASTKVTYTPNSTAGGTAKSCTIYFYLDGLRHILLGARGTFSIALKAGEYGKITFEMTGIYGGPTDTAMVVPTLNATIPPRFLSATFTIGAYAAVAESLSFDIGNKVVKRPSFNAATGILEWLVSDREPKGSVDPEMVLVAAKDFWTQWSASTPLAISAVVGSAAGNKCTITAPAAVMDTPSYGDRENFLTMNMPFSLHPSSAGDDELKLEFA